LFGLASARIVRAVADVWHDQQAGAWLLGMRSTCYVDLSERVLDQMSPF